MAKKRRITGFTRFLLALIVILPSAFVGAALINGEDPVQKFKELVGWETPASTPVDSSSDGGASRNDGTRESLPTRGSANDSSYDDMSRDELLREVYVLDEKLARCRAANVD